MAAKRAMTIFEAAIVAAVLGIVLFIVAGGVGSVRQQAKRNLCARLMAGLGEALAQYHAKTGDYPPGRPDASAGPAIAAMLAVPEAAAELKDLPAVLQLGADPHVGGVDPWGRPVRYLTAASPTESARREVAANGDVPIFESAGGDGDFGETDPAAAADNHRSTD